MKLSDWAKCEGVHYMTAWRWWRAGKLIVPAHQTPSGTIIVEAPEGTTGRTVVYARVCPRRIKPAILTVKSPGVTGWATRRGHAISTVITETGSGQNGCRRKLLRLLADPTISTILVEHRDRLARFGAEVVKAASLPRGAASSWSIPRKALMILCLT